MKKCLILAVFLLFLWGCQKKNDRNMCHFQVENSIEEYPDSSFFSSIVCMNYDKGYIYILDNRRGDIVRLSEDLKSMQYITRHGEAPYETIMPLVFNIFKDSLFVVDFGTRSMKVYQDANFKRSFLLSNASGNRFGLNDSIVFLSATTDSTCMLRISLMESDKQRPMGLVIKEKTPKRTIMLNDKYIFYDSDQQCLYTVSGNYPFIDKYDTGGNLISSFDMSTIPIIRNSIEYSKELPYQENSFYSYIKDAYCTNGFMYLLCSTRKGKKYKVNTILRLNIDMNDYNIYVLPHDFYSSFCVSDSYLFAAQTGRNCSIDKMKL